MARYSHFCPVDNNVNNAFLKLLLQALHGVFGKKSVSTRQTFSASQRKIAPVCPVRWALYFLEPMLIEHGFGTLPGERDRLASDEPNAGLPLPT